MDPITQGAFGASLSLSFSKKKHILLAGIMGFLSGMAPDLDVFIRSQTDPLLFLEYHRQFTHSLIFIPVGGLICAVLFYYLFARRQQLSFKTTYLYCTLGYASHGILDSCTSYGTQLFWPFSNTRVSFDTISIIDPLFSVPLIIFLLLAVLRKNPHYAQMGIVWFLVIQLIGVIQNHRASEAGLQLAQQLGHHPIRLEAKPTFGNSLLWKVIYETNEGFYSHGVRAGIDIVTYPGELIPKLNIERDLPWLDPESQQAKDIERFSWFSQGFVSIDPHNPRRIFDVRYSLLPNRTQGLWGIMVSPDALPYEHARYTSHRDLTDDKKNDFIRMLKNEY